MTEVLSITQPDGNSHFGSSGRRSSSQTSLMLHNTPTYSRTSSSVNSRYAAVGYDRKLPASQPSSAPSSPRLAAPGFSNQPSYTSTPSSSLSLDENCEPEEEEIVFPSYCDVDFLHDVNPAEKVPTITEISEPITHSVSDASLITPRETTAPKRTAAAGDDSTISSEPTRHVDYLSHNWREEDIWSSWRHVVARRNVYSNSVRLENAIWRTWAKSKHRLKTVSPDTLNWMKDHDVTWLYGPLQTGNTKSFNANPTPPASRLSRSNSFASKKPILKKRSLSELMLQRSLSSSTLMKQATDALRAQQPEVQIRERPVLADRALSDFGTPYEMGSPLTRATTEPSTSTSGAATPCTKRHIHFNNKVEQCIAINEEGRSHSRYYNAVQDDDESSEEEMLIMKPVQRTTRSNQSTPRNSFSNESKIIAMLPSTTLNCRGDTPEPADQQKKQKERSWPLGSKLTPSLSQETLKASACSSNFLLDDEDTDVDMDWQPSADRRDSIYSRGRLEMNTTDEDDGSNTVGLRRTPSGMFMPYEDEDDYNNTGIFGKVVDTVNTAKDIAHVIWNVGWRR